MNVCELKRILELITGLNQSITFFSFSKQTCQSKAKEAAKSFAFLKSEAKGRKKEINVFRKLF